jgi:hypothetical protein
MDPPKEAEVNIVIPDEVNFKQTLEEIMKVTLY